MSDYYFKLLIGIIAGLIFAIGILIPIFFFSGKLSQSEIIDKIRDSYQSLKGEAKIEAGEDIEQQIGAKLKGRKIKGNL